MNDDLDRVEAIGTPEEYLNRDDTIAAYRGNPCIGALGPIRTKKQVQELLTIKPTYDPAERGLPAHLRPHVAYQIRQFFVPGIAHVAAVQEVDLLIRQSYLGRNPLDKKHRWLVSADARRMKAGAALPPRYLCVPGLGASVIGHPGTGKTMSVDLALRDFVSSAQHGYRIDGDRLAFTQLPYLKLNLHQDGSLKSFGREIFEQAEQTLEVPLIREWGVDRATTDKIQNLYFQLCWEFKVGLFVVDEFQLIQAVHDGTRRALSYFVRLMNCVGVAVLVIGTPVTADLLKENLAASRRFLCNIPRFEVFTKGKVWDAFFKSLSAYQYVKQMDPVEELANTVLKLSGGVPDLVVKLFLLSQMRLFGREKEHLTSRVLLETSDKLFHSVQDRLLELQGKRPESPEISKVAADAEKTFNQIAAQEAARLGGALPGDLAPTLTPEIVSPKTSSRTKKIRDAGEKGDPIQALEAAGLVAQPL